MTMEEYATADNGRTDPPVAVPVEPAIRTHDEADLRERVTALEMRVRVLDTLVNDLYHRFVSADAAPLVAELDAAVQAVLVQSGMSEDEFAAAFDFTHR